MPKSKDVQTRPFSKKDDDDINSNSTGDPGLSLREKGIYYITGVIESDSLMEIHQDILSKHLDSRWNNDIQIIVNSIGGEVCEMWSLIDLLDWVRMDVRTIGMGCCASAGACLLACGTKGKRVASKNLTVMIHKAWSIVDGKYDELVSRMKDMHIENKRHLDFWIEHSKYKNIKEVETYLLQSTDNYLTATEVLDHGIVDSIAGNQVSKPKTKSK